MAPFDPLPPHQPLSTEPGELGAGDLLLLFEDDERGPSDDLRLQFEAASRLDPDERTTLKNLIEGLLLKHEAKRWAA